MPATFDNRGMDLAPRIDFRFVGYQEASPLPSRPTNEAQREIVRKAGLVLGISTPEQRKRGRPVKIDKRLGAKPKSPINSRKLNDEQEMARRAHISAQRQAESIAIIRKLFAAGNMNTHAVQVAVGHKEQRYTTRLLREMVKRGVIKQAGMEGKLKVWGLV